MMLPENHGKDLRLDIVQSLILNNLNDVSNTLNVDGVNEYISENYDHNSYEDPIECSFTDNIQFLNGNNIVFPGIVSNCANTVQYWLEALFLKKNNLDETVLKEIRDHVFFCLEVQNNLALAFGLGRYSNRESFDSEIEFPDQELFEEKKNQFVFNQHDLTELYSKYEIECNPIDSFLTNHESEEINPEDFENNPLLLKPFVRLGEEHHLLFPRCLLYALNEWIVKKLKESELLDDALEFYYDCVLRDIKNVLRSMKWSETDLLRKKDQKVTLSKSESIWQFDVNKLACVRLLFGEESKTTEKDRPTKVLQELKKTLISNEFNFLEVNIFSAYSLKDHKFFSFEENEHAEHAVAISNFDLQRFVSYWKIDQLSLWKYCKAESRTESKGLMIFPGFSILTHYKWYHNNGDSFFHPDDQYSWLTFDFSMQGEVVTTVNSNDDRHLELFINDNKTVYVPVYKTEKYAPIYTSEEIFGRIYRKAINILEFPIWVTATGESKYLCSLFTDSVVYWLYELRGYFTHHLEDLPLIPISIVLSIGKGQSMITESRIEE